MLDSSSTLRLGAGFLKNLCLAARFLWLGVRFLNHLKLAPGFLKHPRWVLDSLNTSGRMLGSLTPTVWMVESLLPLYEM